MNETLLKRFWLKVDQSGGPDACWLWTGIINPQSGYGQLNVNGQNDYAHRIAYRLLIGPIPDGFTIDHVRARGCRHRHCVNPAHLEAVTSRENTLRAPTAPATINAKKTHCKHGHEFTEANTYQGRLGRSCRTCHRLHEERRRNARRAVSA